MHAFTTLSLALMAITQISAGHTNSPSPRHSEHGPAHRRHHARHGSHNSGIRRVVRRASDCGDSNTSSTSNTTQGSIGNNAVAVTTCTAGAWQCSGSQLQECYNNKWNTVQTCSGANIVCSAANSVIGCVYTWQLPSSGSATSSSITTSTSPTSTSPLSSTPSGSTTDEEDDEDCEDEDDSTSMPTGSVTSMKTGISTSMATSTIQSSASLGVNLVASGRSSSHPASQSSSIASARSSSSAKSASSAASSASSRASSAASSTRSGQSSASLATSTKTSSGSLSTATGVVQNVTAGTTTFAAPHYVIYADNWLFSMPSVSDLASYNRFILSFWMTTGGAVDDAAAWAGFDASYRASVIKSYHNAGIALMVSAFGSTDAPTSNGADPIQTARDLATWVKQYGLDGVDIDYEDMPAMNDNSAEAWIISFQTKLRELLPAPYLISHAPVAPWFTSANVYAAGAYVEIFKQVGSGIDFFNVQFYNQGNIYLDCTTLITKSGGSWPSTSVMEIHSYTGVPLNKIVIGKPLDTGAADNGYMTPAALNKCGKQAEGLGWNGGFMFWEWTSAAPAIMAAVRA